MDGAPEPEYLCFKILHEPSLESIVEAAPDMKAKTPELNFGILDLKGDMDINSGDPTTLPPWKPAVNATNYFINANRSKPLLIPGLPFLPRGLPFSADHPPPAIGYGVYADSHLMSILGFQDFQPTRLWPSYTGVSPTMSTGSNLTPAARPPPLQPIGLSSTFQSPFGHLAGLLKNGELLNVSTMASTQKQLRQRTWAELVGASKLRRTNLLVELSEPEPQMDDRTSEQTYLPYAYQADNTNYSFGTAEFYIECPPNSNLFPASFYVAVSDSYGLPCITRILTEELKPHRYTCEFRTQGPGNYTGVVKLKQPEAVDIIGSPINLTVCRNYEKTGRSQIIANLEKLNGGYKTKIWGICVDKKTDKIYVADRHASMVYVFNTNGVLQNSFGSEGHRLGQLFRPSGLAVDETNRRLYITDKDNHRVCIYTLDGRFIKKFGSRGCMDGQMSYPWGIDVTVSPKGTLVVVADSRNRRLQLFDGEGNYLRKFSAYDQDEDDELLMELFQHPRGVCFNNAGDLIYVTDFNSQTLQEFNVGLTEMKILVEPGYFFRPQGLAVDNKGNILVCDSKHHAIRIFESDGTARFNVSEEDCSSNDIPVDISILSDGRIVFVDFKGILRII